MTWMLTGGAGYIGSHIVHSLHATGRPVVVLDNLSTGAAGRLPADVPLEVCSVLDAAVVADAMRRHAVTGVIHLAGKKSVAESVRWPTLYYEQNALGVERLLQAMRLAGVRRLVYSSTAAVYGVRSAVASESSPTRPVNPYGASKLAGENRIRDTAQRQDLRWVALRYFNVAGSRHPLLADAALSNLIPATFRALETGRTPQIFGADYDTPDGTCIRDFVHVDDLADAHVAATERLEADGPGPGVDPALNRVYNVGTGRGASVCQVLALVAHLTGQPFVPVIAPRRPGDPPALVAQVGAVHAALGWQARRDLPETLLSAWANRHGTRWTDKHGGRGADATPPAAAPAVQTLGPKRSAAEGSRRSEEAGGAAGTHGPAGWPAVGDRPGGPRRRAWIRSERVEYR